MRRGARLLLTALLMAQPAFLMVQSPDAYARKGRSHERSHRDHENRAVARVATADSVQAASAGPNFSTAWNVNLTLSTDRPSYKAGDLMTIAAVADSACDLTLISIDVDGFAVVLFPNEYEPDNMMNAGMPVTVPRADAAYQLRAKKAGTETLLGICAPPGSRPRGIAPDYERYRFTLLGDWAQFTSTIAQREADIVKTFAEERRHRSRKAPVLTPLLPPSDSSSQGRSMILVPVSDGQ